jgi:hypothetical protein
MKSNGSMKRGNCIVTEMLTLIVVLIRKGSTQSSVIGFLLEAEFCRSLLWSSGQSSWLQIRRPGFDSRHYQKRKVVGLERDPLSLVSTT